MVAKIKLNPKVVLFNGAAGIIMLSAAVVQVKSMIFKPKTLVCSERYDRTIRFSLERNGALLSAADIQSTAAGSDFGVMENFTVERVKGSPTPSVFSVDIQAGTRQAQNESGQPGGISFPWRPRALPPGAKSACLGYSVFLPEDFEFDAGGVLPGLFGVYSSDQSQVDRFDVRAEWGEQGKAVQFMMFTSEKAAGNYRTDGSSSHVFPRGRWTRVDQEVVLNDPGTQNGIVRYWINGDLVQEHLGVELRTTDKVAIDGVAVDVHFGQFKAEAEFPAGRARKAEKITVTSFEMKFN